MTKKQLQMTLKLTKKQLAEMDKLEVGDTIEQVTYKGIYGYIERVASDEVYNIRYNYKNFIFRFYRLIYVKIKEVNDRVE